EEMKLHPVIFPIGKTDQVEQHLHKQGLSLQSVPSKDQHVELFFRVALAPGGIVETIDQSTIPKENAELFNRVVKMFNANVLGVDVIFERGIEESHKTQKCILIEVNSRPYMKMHYYPRYGGKEDFSRHIDQLEQLEVENQDTF
ncbi:MAG: cyanophycin synthetase, partial [Pseudomonadota bacterium]